MKEFEITDEMHKECMESDFWRMIHAIPIETDDGKINLIKVNGKLVLYNERRPINSSSNS